MKYHLGLDVGSVNAKLALVGEDRRVVHLDIEKITSNTAGAVNSLLTRLGAGFPLDGIMSVGVSGCGKDAFSKKSGWVDYSSSLAIAAGLLHDHPDARTIIQIGGQSSMVIELTDGLKKPWKLASNSLCAAGTGRFLEQQAYRLGISMEDFASLALRHQGKPPRIAARCSVFAKTDLIHLQQKGVPVEDLLYALCESIARMVASLQKGAFLEPVYFVGGVAANPAIAHALNDVLSEKNKSPVQVIVPENYRYTEALGAALLSIGKNSPVSFIPAADERHNRFFEMPKLETVSVPGNGVSKKIEEPCSGYLGIDVGSTSTKAVIMDGSGKKVLAKSYLMTAGRPVDAVKQVFKALLGSGAGLVKIAAVGVTGSGRYLVGSLVGADLIKNEITAQTRAGAEIDPEADIIEIGGQDSKLVLKRNGVVVDYQMNKACAAGTGSFIDELAEMLKIPVKNGEFARLAFSAPHTVDLGTRCAAFMSQAVTSAQQEGVSLEVITASLAQAIARNYLTKVVGTRKLGNKIILTGAVFYNQAVVAAFRQQLRDKTLVVAEQREVSGAIGAALLAKETSSGKSKFKGFQKVIDSDCNLSAFTCEGCDNGCTITRMQLPGEKTTYYGSRCDRYDSTVSQTSQETLFDAREKLLFQDYKPGAGSGVTVGLPRALMVYEFAPLLLGFLNELGVRVVLSGKTTKAVMEQAIELSYSDSCFPLKLLYGHVASLGEADYILYPSFLRLGRKEGDANQKYACPLIQASPFIIRHALNLDEKMLIPFVDFSQGDNDVIESFTKIAGELGFSRDKGKKAAQAGIKAQQRFENDVRALGEKTLRELRETGELGVVLLSRPYMSQDSGANLGIAEKLAQLGVVPVPLDFLPLSSENPKKYSDRPYWYCEGQHIAGAAVTAPIPGLFGLVLTNFGCGPNSFILKIIEDIMGGKPLGELEIDEHAAEAGIVTRLEAFVDTINGYAKSARRPAAADKDIYRKATAVIDVKKTLILPRMSPHVDVLVAAMKACGARAVVLPEPEECNLIYSNEVTSGRECLPFRVTLGDFIRFCRDNDGKTDEYEGLMAGAYGPCRLGKYALEHDRILKEMGYDLPILSTVSNSAYRDLNLGGGFLHFAMNCTSAVDGLQRLLWHTRPYEKRPGSADALFSEYLKRLADRAEKKEKFYDLLMQAAQEFKELVDSTVPPKPLVGINGEIYLRTNRFSNRDLVKVCEKSGLEVVVSPIIEWGNYVVHRYLEDALKEHRVGKIVSSYVIGRVLKHDELQVASSLGLKDESPISELLDQSKAYLSPRCGSEAVLSIATGVEWMKNPEFAGVISVMPHGCMPGGIVAAMSDRFSAVYQKPWISVTYDGFMETNNLTRVREFAELVKFCNNGIRQGGSKELL